MKSIIHKTLIKYTHGPKAYSTPKPRVGRFERAVQIYVDIQLSGASSRTVRDGRTELNIAYEYGHTNVACTHLIPIRHTAHRIDAKCASYSKVPINNSIIIIIIIVNISVNATQRHTLTFPNSHKPTNTTNSNVLTLIGYIHIVIFHKNWYGYFVFS